MRQRIALFLPSLRGGGAEVSTLKLAQAIAASQCAVDLVLAKAEGPFLSEVPATIQTIDLESSRMLFCLPKLVGYLRRVQPNALLSAMDYANIVALWAGRLARFSGRTAIVEHNTLSLHSRRGLSTGDRLMPRLARRFYPWANQVLAISEGVAEDLCQVTGLPRTDIQVIYNAVITPELQDKAQAPLDHPWFQIGQPPVVLAVGRLTEQKDFGNLLRAFAEIRQTRPARLLILGEGPDRPHLQQLIARLGLQKDAALPGFVANPYAYMSRAAVYALSSAWEGLPTVLIEALYCGAQIVATDCASGPREILAGGEYGQLVPVGDSGLLAQAMEKALAEGRQRPPPASWQAFRSEAVVGRYLDVLLGSG